MQQIAQEVGSVEQLILDSTFVEIETIGQGFVAHVSKKNANFGPRKVIASEVFHGSNKQELLNWVGEMLSTPPIKA